MSEQHNFADDPTKVEADLARSAWFDPNFAVWFKPFARSGLLFGQLFAAQFFERCGDFAKTHRVGLGTTGDNPDALLPEIGARNFFSTLKFTPLPGGATHKPTSWQIEKARKYLASRNNILLAEGLRDAEDARARGEHVRADQLAAEARKAYGAFADKAVTCEDLFDEPDEIFALAESTPPLFTLDGEIGRLLNHRLKPDNLGVLLADPKVGKTTDLVSFAVAAARRTNTLLVSTGDESKVKLKARVLTNITCSVTQREFVGDFAMPVPDCQHNADGSCPIGRSGEPRRCRSWRRLIEDGETPESLCQGHVDAGLTLSGGIYRPCANCYPMNDGTQEDRERRRRWRSAVWWRMERFDLLDREIYARAKRQYAVEFGGRMKLAAYKSGELGIDGLYSLLDTLDRVDNFVPQVIVVDYADLMRQEAGRDTDKDHDGIRRIWEGLRGISSSLHNLLLTATQSNRLSEDIETHTRRTIGRSAKAADNATWFASVNQTVTEKRAKLMRLSMMYAREGSFDPEHQALCCQWHEIQDGYAFSMPTFCKTKTEKEKDR